MRSSPWTAARSRCSHRRKRSRSHRRTRRHRVLDELRWRLGGERLSRWRRWSDVRQGPGPVVGHRRGRNERPLARRGIRDRDERASWRRSVHDAGGGTVEPSGHHGRHDERLLDEPERRRVDRESAARRRNSGGAGCCNPSVGDRRRCVDAASVCWTSLGDGTVRKVPLGGGTPVTIASGQLCPQAIAVDGTSVYWTTLGEGSSAGTVMKAPKQ